MNAMKATKSKTIAFRVSDQTAELIRVLAKRERLKPSAWARAIVLAEIVKAKQERKC